VVVELLGGRHGAAPPSSAYVGASSRSTVELEQPPLPLKQPFHGSDNVYTNLPIYPLLDLKIYIKIGTSPSIFGTGPTNLVLISTFSMVPPMF